MKYRAPHEVEDQAKLDAMIAILENGGQLPPVLVCGEVALSGSHRLAAWSQLGMEPEVVELDDSEYSEIMEKLGLDPIYDEPTEMEEFMAMAKELGYAGDAR